MQVFTILFLNDMIIAPNSEEDSILMSELKGAIIVGQSGGPTSVINSSVYGVIDTALKNPNITRVLGAEHGIKGVLNDRLFDMADEDPAELELLTFEDALKAQPEPQYYSADGVHPNANGAEFIGKHYFNAIAPLIESGVK